MKYILNYTITTKIKNIKDIIKHIFYRINSFLLPLRGHPSGR